MAKRRQRKNSNGKGPDVSELIKGRHAKIQEVEQAIVQLQRMIVEQTQLLHKLQGQLVGIMEGAGWGVEQVNEVLGMEYLSVGGWQDEDETEPSPAGDPAT